jgi:hypothetical protein
MSDMKYNPAGMTKEEAEARSDVVLENARNLIYKRIKEKYDREVIPPSEQKGDI